MTTNTDTTRTFGFLLGTAARLLRRRFDQQARESGLSRAQAQALFFIQRKEGTNQACLAEALEIEPITLTRLLDRMEEAGWIERRADPKDRRIRRLYLMEKATPTIAEMRAIADVIYEEAFVGIDADERSAIMASLEKVISNLSERNPGGRQPGEACAPAHGDAPHPSSPAANAAIEAKRS